MCHHHCYHWHPTTFSFNGSQRSVGAIILKSKKCRYQHDINCVIHNSREFEFYGHMIFSNYCYHDYRDEFACTWDRAVSYYLYNKYLRKNPYYLLLDLC